MVLSMEHGYPNQRFFCHESPEMYTPRDVVVHLVSRQRPPCLHLRMSALELLLTASPPVYHDTPTARRFNRLVRTFPCGQRASVRSHVTTYEGRPQSPQNAPSNPLVHAHVNMKMLRTRYIGQDCTPPASHAVHTTQHDVLRYPLVQRLSRSTPACVSSKARPSRSSYETMRSPPAAVEGIQMYRLAVTDTFKEECAEAQHSNRMHGSNILFYI